MTAAWLALCLLGADDPDDADRRAVAAIREQYESNRGTLATRGVIRFHACDGLIGRNASVEAFDAAFRGPWLRKSPSRGTYLFDGMRRRYDSLYSVEQVAARRGQASPGSSASEIQGLRLLTDGATTLIDSVHVARHDDVLMHSPNLRAGASPFFREAIWIPLQLGDPEPPRHELAVGLRQYLDDRAGTVGLTIDREAFLGDVPVIEIRLDFHAEAGRRRITWWLDPARGAIPLQVRMLEEIPQIKRTALTQINQGDLRPAGGGWLPFRWSLAEGYLAESGGVDAASAVEVVLESADFSTRPPLSSFSMEFPEPRALSDPDRRLGFGSRRVWSLKDLSLDQARPLGQDRSRPAPGMPASPWTILLGLAPLIPLGIIAYRKFRPA